MEGFYLPSSNGNSLITFHYSPHRWPEGQTVDLLTGPDSGRGDLAALSLQFRRPELTLASQKSPFLHREGGTMSPRSKAQRGRLPRPPALIPAAGSSRARPCEGREAAAPRVASCERDCRLYCEDGRARFQPSPRPVLGRTPREGAVGRQTCPRSSSGYRSPAHLSSAPSGLRNPRLG